MLKGILQADDTRVEVVWIKCEEQLGVVCIKVMVKGKGGDESAEGDSVHDEKQRTENGQTRCF